MNAPFTRIFTVEINRRPIVAFEARNSGEANSILKEEWFLDDLRRLKSEGTPLWDGSAPIRARVAGEEEVASYNRVAAEADDPNGEILLVFLVSLDGAS